VSWSIVLVEDDRSIQRALQMNLDLEGFRVRIAHDGDEGLRLIRESHPDAVLLDLMLPGMQGMDVIRHVRSADADTPIIVLSARDQEGDKVLALSLGADDYVVKPFGMAELLARIRAALRRRRRLHPAEEGRVRVLADARAILVDGKAIETTAREFDLLAFLAVHPGVVFTREQLMGHVWGTGYFGTPRTVDNFIGRLREKIEVDASAPRHLETVRGIGYRFNP